MPTLSKKPKNINKNISGKSGASKLGKKTLKNVSGQGKSIAKKEKGGAEEIKKQISPIKGSGSAKDVAKETGRRSISLGLSVPDIVIMLPIAVALDFASIIGFFLWIIGLGAGVQYVVSIGGNLVIGFWVITSSLFRGVVQKTISYVEEKVESMGKNKQKGGGSQASMPGQELGKKATKKTITAGAEIIVWLVFSLPKLIPILGSLWPGFTITVLRIIAIRTIQGT